MAKRKKNKNAKIKYRLYAFPPTEENLHMVEKYRFYRITSKYILLYYGGHRIINYNEIKDNDLHYLSYADKRWLLDCNMAIIAEETVKHKDVVATNMGLMLDRLETALQAEKAKGSLNDGQTEA